MQPSPLAFEFRGITKAFGSVVANRDVSFGARRGSIHGVVGENGAGKSTILKILYGLYQPDSGEILIDGKPTPVPSPLAAIRLGVGMVHQHFMLVPTLTVWENIVLGLEPTLGKRLRDRSLKALRPVLADAGLSTLDLEARVEDLPVGLQQQVEILKLLYRKADILILDEPTAVLTPQETNRLLAQMQRLRDLGKTVVLISHKLREILRFTEAVTVLRQGQVVDTSATSTLTEQSLAEKMVGRGIRRLPERATVSSSSPPVVEARNVSLTRGSTVCLRDLTFDVRAGEIVGFAGVEGNGQRELVEVLSNVDRRYDGEIFFEGKPLRPRQVYDLKQQGLAVIPPDRHREGLVLDFSVAENCLLGHHRESRFTRGPWLSRRKIAAEVTALVERLDVRPRHPDATMRGLSGGNQQKVIIGRELSGPVKLLVAAHPTRGVDIGAIEFIHSQFLKLRDAGTAIVLVSSELDEIRALADRIFVLFEGRIQGETTREKADEGQLGIWMTGGTA